MKLKNWSSDTMHKIAKNLLLFISVLLCISIILGISYAYWKLVLKQKDPNTLTSDCFSITFSDENAISLAQAYPLNKEEMKTFLKNATPYHFTITNKCNSVARGYINLETLPVVGKKLRDQYVDVLLYDGNVNLSNEIYNDYLNNISPSNIVAYPINDEKVIDDSLAAYKLRDILLREGETLEFNLLLWMDESAPASDEVMNAYWNGKITVSADYSTLKPGDDLYYEISELCYMVDFGLDKEKCLQTLPAEESLSCDENYIESRLVSNNREEIEEIVNAYIENYDFLTLNEIIETRFVNILGYKSGGTYINNELDYIEGTNMHAVIPDEIDGYPVMSILGPFSSKSVAGFSGYTYKGSSMQGSTISGYNYGVIITSLNIGANIISIDDGTFRYNRLESIKFDPNCNLQSINNSAFQGNLLTELTFPKTSYFTLEKNSFADNRIENVQFNSPVSIAENAFLNNQISELRFDYFGTSIEKCAFCNNPITKIINNTGQAFNWSEILSGESGNEFETGTLEIAGRTVQITKG